MAGSPTRSEARAPILQQRRREKMAESLHAFVRGSPDVFYHWLDGKAGQAVPEGPSIWIGGDCHLGNLGPLADERGEVALEIRDFDQAVVGNPAFDLLRLGVSLATTALASDLGGPTVAAMVERMVHDYEAVLGGHGPREEPKRIRRLMRRALGRSWQDLLDERIDDTDPTFPLGEQFWTLTERERAALERLVASDDIADLVRSFHDRDDDDAVKLRDAAFWVKGCSSLGRLRIAALLSVGKKSLAKGRISLLDLKEAPPPVARRSLHASMPRRDAERVVTAARHLSPKLGERMRPARVLGREVVVRELLPQDLKVEIDELDPDEAIATAGYLAAVVARAHARQLDASDRAHWRRALERAGPRSKDSPSWLWKSIVALVAEHEAAYLRHCRELAPRAA